MRARAFDAGHPLAYPGAAMTSPSEPRELPKTARAYHEAAPRIPEAGLDLLEIFSGCSGIEIEIGFGRGQFLIQRRAAAPDVGLLGIEIKSKWAYLVADKCARLQLPNMRVLGGDARVILPALRPAASVQRVVMCFPDPWWKKRHAERRLMDESLLSAIARLLVPHGELFVQTDVAERAAQYLERFDAHPAFERVTDSGLIPDNPLGAQSNRETRAIKDGLPIYRVLVRKRA